MRACGMDEDPGKEESLRETALDMRTERTGLAPALPVCSLGPLNNSFPLSSLINKPQVPISTKIGLFLDRMRSSVRSVL